MGIYINPRNLTKREWLEACGQPLSGAPDQHRVGDEVAVCLVDNGAFDAAGVAFSHRELEAFTDPDDGRRKRWYRVALSDLIAVGAITSPDDIEPVEE